MELGEKFLSGKVTSEELEEKIMKTKYDEYWWMVLGLAVAFGLEARNKSYNEVLTSVKEFVSRQ